MSAGKEGKPVIGFDKDSLKLRIKSSNRAKTNTNETEDKQSTETKNEAFIFNVTNTNTSRAQVPSGNTITTETATATATALMNTSSEKDMMDDPNLGRNVIESLFLHHVGNAGTVDGEYSAEALLQPNGAQGISLQQVGAPGAMTSAEQMQGEYNHDDVDPMPGITHDFSYDKPAEEMREPSIPSPVFITPSRSTRSQSAALLRRDDGDDGSANDDIKKEEDEEKAATQPSANKRARSLVGNATKRRRDESSDEKEKVTTTSIEGDKNPRDNEGEEDMEELDIGLLVSQALEGSKLDRESKISLVDALVYLMRFSPSDKNEKLETGSRKTPNVPFTLNEGQKKKIRVHKSVNMDSAVLALNRFLVNVLWIWYAGDFTNKIVTISPGPLKDFFIDPDNLNSLVQLCLSDPLIARIRFVHTAPVKKNIKKGEIYVVLEKSNDLRNFATAHWAWFHRDYLSRKHLEYIRPNENSMNCSTILKSLQFISEIGNDMIILATVDYVDSKGNIHSDLQLSVIQDKKLIKDLYNKKLEERNHKVALNDQGEIIDRMILDDKWLVLDRISLGLGVAGAVPYDKLGKLTSIVRQLEKKEKKSSTDNKKDVTAERSSAEQRDESRRIMQSLYVDAVSGLNAFSKYTHQMLDDRQESDEKLRNLFGELNEAGASILTIMRAIGDLIGTPWEGQEKVDDDDRDEKDEHEDEDEDGEDGEDEERPAKRFKSSEPQTQTGKKKRVADEDSESDDSSSSSSEESSELVEISDVSSSVENGDNDAMDIDEQSFK